MTSDTLIYTMWGDIEQKKKTSRITFSKKTASASHIGGVARTGSRRADFRRYDKG